MTWRLPPFGRTAIEDDRHPVIAGEGPPEMFVIVQGVTRHDEEQTGTWGGWRLPIVFTTLPWRVSGHRRATEQQGCQHRKVMIGRLLSEITSARPTARVDSFGTRSPKRGLISRNQPRKENLWHPRPTRLPVLAAAL